MMHTPNSNYCNSHFDCCEHQSTMMKILPFPFLALLVAMQTSKETLGFVLPSNPCSRIPKQNSNLHANLITFDLDDTIFPVGPVVADANKALFEHLKGLGCETTQEEYLKTAKQIRNELTEAITYTELRKRTIRREMEKCFNKSISDEIVVNSYDIWEEHRHIAAETHLYKDTVAMLQELKTRYPDAVIGAITNGKGNPLMMESIKEYFDFCISGEDDDVFPLRKPSEGIYRKALERFREMTKSEEEDDCCWVHVGDDLANDVGASAQCGAKAVWVDLDEEEYDQSASARDPNKPQPAWSTATKEELEKRKKMDKEAQQYVTKRVTTLQMLPSSIEEIAKEERSGIRIQ